MSVSVIEIALLVCEVMGICNCSLIFLWVNLGSTFLREYLNYTRQGLGPFWIPVLLACFLMALDYCFGWAKRDAETAHLLGLGIVITLGEGIPLYSGSRLIPPSEISAVLVQCTTLILSSFPFRTNSQGGFCLRKVQGW